MLINVLQRIIRWMPLALLILLFMVDRDNAFHKFGYRTLLLLYTCFLIMRILYAKERWHDEFNMPDVKNDAKIEKMSDYKEKLENNYDTDKVTGR